MHFAELRRIPSPHAEKYSTYQKLGSPSSKKGKQDYRKEEPQNEPHSYNRVELYYDRQPFVSNGYFTPNPTNDSVQNSDHQGKTARPQHKSGERAGFSHDSLPSSAKTHSHELHTPSRNRSQLSVEAEKSVPYSRYRDLNKVKNNEASEIRKSFVSSNDFKTEESKGEAEEHSHNLKVHLLIAYLIMQFLIRISSETFVSFQIILLLVCSFVPSFDTFKECLTILAEVILIVSRKIV